MEQIKKRDLHLLIIFNSHLQTLLQLLFVNARDKVNFVSFSLKNFLFKKKQKPKKKKKLLYNMAQKIDEIAE